MSKHRHLRRKPSAAAKRSHAPSERESTQPLPHKAIFRVQGIHCASCVVRIERKLKQLEGVQAVQVDAITGKAELLCTSAPQ